MLRDRFTRYAQNRLRADLTGAEVAARMLAKHSIEDVRIIHSPGYLTDHYNPVTKTINLSRGVYEEKHTAAAAVAAHECGHAVQHAQGYALLQFRSAMVPALSVASRYMPWVILIGILLVDRTPIPLEIGIGLFSMTTLFTFLTLPIEFDASRRALAWLNRETIVTSQEYTMAKDALWWAAMTYVIAALGSLAQLLRLISTLNRRRQ